MNLRSALLTAVFALCIAAVAGDAGPPAKPPYDFIVWDGHRYARTNEDHERDIRYFRDLGFTHSFLGNASVELPKDVERIRTQLALCGKYGLNAGLKFDACGCKIRSLDEYAKMLGTTKEQLAETGMLLDNDSSNPMHPDLIRFYAEGHAKVVAFCRENDPGKRLRLFLLGSEFTWDLPKNVTAANSKALAHVFKAAREDGVLKEGQPDDLAALGNWWAGPHEKGRDWRLRRAIEDEILKIVPDADFMIDPIWAVKLVHGFGAEWEYIANDPKRLAVGALRIRAQCRPSPAAYSVQLLRQSGGGKVAHDMVLVGDLIALCLGVEKLYHWGVHHIEPGITPGYGVKNLKPTPAGFPYFTEKQFANWDATMAALVKQSDKDPGKRIFAMLDAGPRERMKLKEMEDQFALISALVKSLNAVLKRVDLYDEAGFAGVKLGKRGDELLNRRKAAGGVLEGDDLAEFNRLLIEAALAGGMPATPEPNARKLVDDIVWQRKNAEPALRSIGRLLRDRGDMFRDWKPHGPRVALIAGIYGHGETVLSMVAAHIPLDILRNQADRRDNLPKYPFAAVTGDVPADDYAGLLKIVEAGGTVFVPEGFKPPEGRPALTRTAVWAPGGKEQDIPKEMGEVFRTKVTQSAAKMKDAFRKGGLLPYADCESADVVLQSYSYKNCPVVFVVNDRRVSPTGGDDTLASKGIALDVDILIRETVDVLRVIDVDTGAEVKAVRKDDGWHILDTIEPAWYRLYAILKKGETWPGPGPLAAGPAITNLTAQRDAAKGGVVLAWKPAVDDWVGCDLQNYRIFRSETGREAALLAEVDGRVMQVGSPGGLVTTHTDTTAKPGVKYSYRIQTVTPLRRTGPMSDTIDVAP